MIYRGLVLLSCLWLWLPSVFAAECLTVYPHGFPHTLHPFERLSNFPTNSSTAHLSNNTVVPRGDNFYLSTLGSGTITIGPATATESTARIYVRTSASWHNVVINAGGNPEDVIIIIDGALAISGSSTDINAIIYVAGATNISGSGSINGAIATAGTATSSIAINYQASYINNADFNGMCDAPIANFRFDECQYSGSGIEVIDQLGNYSGTSHGDLNTFAVGQIARAANLTDRSHHIETSIALSSRFTVSSWFKKPTATNGSRYFILGAMATGGDLLYLDRSNNWRWGVYSGSGSGVNGNFSFASLNNNWHHLALVYSPGQTKLYIDGSLVDTILAAPTGTLKYIGTSYDDVNSNNAQGFRAPLDEFMVFDTNLSASRISDIYNHQLLTNNYDGSARAAVNCNFLLAWYNFEQNSFPAGAGGILDDSGANNHATNIGGVSIPNGKYCRGFDSNGTNNATATNNAFRSSLDLDNDVGTRGTISFWYRANNPWNRGGRSNNKGRRTLFDATQVASDKFFTLQVRDNGRLRFSFEDSNDSNFRVDEPSVSVRPANTWYYLSVTWDYSIDQFAIFVNGVAVITKTRNTNGVVPDLDPIVFGDNASSYSANNSNWLPARAAANGQFDEVRIYSQVLSQAEIQADMIDDSSCLPDIDHFEITHDGNGLTCAPETITITACSDSNCNNIYNTPTPVELSVNGNAEQTITVTGQSQLTFDHTVAETISLSLNESHICINGSSSSCNMVFADAGFLFSTIDEQVAGVTFTPTIQAVQNTAGVCTALFNGNKTIELAMQHQIALGTVTNQLFINNTNSTTVNIADTELSDPLNYSSVSLNFDGTATAELTNSRYDDASQIKLHARYIIPATATDPSVTITGSSATFWVRPDHFTVVAKKGAVQLNNSSTTGDPKAKAGEDFSLTISAENAANNITKNYRLQSNSKLQLAVGYVLPNVVDFNNLNPAILFTYASNGHIAPQNQNQPLTYTDALGVDFSNPTNNLDIVTGQYTFSLAKYSDVGVVKLFVKDTNYNVNPVGSGVIGRFIPAKIVVSVLSPPSQPVTNFCSNMTYMGQPFQLSYKIEAQNTSGVITQNYFGNLVNSELSLVAENAGDGINLAAAPNNPSTDPPNRLPYNVPDWNKGKIETVQTVVFSRLPDNSIPLQHNGPDGPYENLHYGVKLTDSESDVQLPQLELNMLGNTAKKISSSASRLLYGRLTMTNNFTLFTSPLDISLAVQYFNGSLFTTNTADNCTSYINSDISLDNANLLPALPVNATSVIAPSSSTSVIEGEGNFTLSASTPDKGQIRLSYTNLADWLKGDWNGNGVYDEAASAIGSFGDSEFQSSKRIIYWREKQND